VRERARRTAAVIVQGHKLHAEALFGRSRRIGFGIDRAVWQAIVVGSGFVKDKDARCIAFVDALPIREARLFGGSSGRWRDPGWWGMRGTTAISGWG
jgi:hypothetical protein